MGLETVQAAGRSGGPSPAEPPALRAQGPKAVGPRVSAAPAALSVPLPVRPAALLLRPTPASPARGSPRSGPRAGAAARRGAAAPRTSTILPGKVAPKQAAGPGAGSGCRVTIFFPSRLFVHRRFTPSPSGLVHSLPLLGRPPSTRRFAFPRHLVAGRGPSFLSFLSFCLSGILITYFSSFTKIRVLSLYWFYFSPVPGVPAQA